MHDARALAMHERKLSSNRFKAGIENRRKILNSSIRWKIAIDISIEALSFSPFPIEISMVFATGSIANSYVAELHPSNFL